MNLRVSALGVLLLANATAFSQQNLSIAGLPNDDRLALIISNDVRLRSSPSTSGAILRALNAGDFAIVTGESSDPQQIGEANYFWEHLKLIDGTEGWSYGEYVYEHPRITLDFTFDARIGNTDYTVAEFVSPVSADMRRGVPV